MSEGLYKLPKGWRWVRLGEVAEVRGGIAFPLKYQGRIHGKFPFYKVSDMNLPGNQIVMEQSTNWIDDSLVPLIGAKPFAPETIIFPKVGGAIYTNKKRLLRVESFIDNNLMGVTVFPHSRCYPRFLFYWFGTINLRDLSNPGPLPSINAARVKSLSLPLPPLPEQHRIVARIEELMGRVQEARRLREEAKQDAERLWQAVLAQTFPRPGTELPEGWRWVRLGEVCDTRSGGTPSRKRPELYGGPIPWVKSGELNDNVITSCEESITEEALQQSNAKVFPSGTLLVALYGATAGKVAILGMNAATNQAVCGIFPKNKDKVHTPYLFYALIHRRESLLRERYGGAQPNVSQLVLREFRLALPPLPEQRRIVAYLEAVQERIRALKEAQNATEVALKHLERAILERAFRGEL